jgi:hypothetical protein
MAKKTETKKASRSPRNPIKTRAQKIEIARVISTTNSILGLINFNRKENIYTYSDARNTFVNADISKLENELLKNGIKFGSIRFSTYYDRINKRLI